jgi:hypothetical protein
MDPNLIPAPGGRRHDMAVRRRRITGFALLAGAGPLLIGQGAVASAEARSGPARSVAPGLRLAPGDQFGLAKLSVPSAPRVFTGRVQRRLTGADSAPAVAAAEAAVGAPLSTRAAPAAQVRVDVYLNPVHGGRPYPLAFALTDARGAFSINGTPPANLSGYQGSGRGAINATVVYSDLQTGATQLTTEMLAWDGAARTWHRVTPDDLTWARDTPAAVVLDVSAQALARPGLRQVMAQAAASSSPTCREDSDPADASGWTLDVQPTWVNVFDALAENLADNDWTEDGDYQRISSTSVDTLDSVSVDASFGVDFPEVSLQGSGSAVISTGTGNSTDTTLGFGFSVENLPVRHYNGRSHPIAQVAPATVDAGTTLNLKYGVLVQSDARLYQCIDVPTSFTNGYTTYDKALYKIQVGPEIDGASLAGFATEDGYYLDGVDGGYRQACGSAYESDDQTTPVPVGGYFSRSNGQTQTFTHGEQATYGAALSAIAASTGASTTQAKRATVTQQTDVKMTWTNNTTAQKYVCGYGALPTVAQNAPPIVAVGANPDGT